MADAIDEMTPLAREGSTDATVGSAYRRDAHCARRSGHHRPGTHRVQRPADAIVTRQAIADPFPWPVLGPTRVTGHPMAPIPEPPAWWAEALFAS